MTTIGSSEVRSEVMVGVIGLLLMAARGEIKGCGNRVASRRPGLLVTID